MPDMISMCEKDADGNLGANAVDALFAISRSLDAVAFQLKWLGNADACTPFGAMEALGIQFKAMAESLNNIAVAVTP